MAKDLEYYLAQARRIAEHREAGAEKEIRKLYKAMLKDLQIFISETYVRYAEEDKLTFAMLQKAGYDARFLEEVEQRLNISTPKAAQALRDLVETTYAVAWNGMYEGVAKSATTSIAAEFAGYNAITPEQIRRAVENPVYGLTLKDTLEKNRKEIIYGIKQSVGIGLMNGDRYTTMARRIAEQVDGDYTKAIRIARTEAHRTREAGNADAAVEVDKELQGTKTGLRMTKTWKTMKDERVRPQRRRKGKGGWSTKMGKGPNHMILDGQTVLADEEFDLQDGHTAMAPGQSGVAGHDINCRCFVSYQMMTDAEYFAKTGKHFPGWKQDSEEVASKQDIEATQETLTELSLADRLSEAKTTREVSDIAAEYFKGKEGCNIRNVDFGKCEVGAAKDMAVKLDTLDSTYKSSLTDISVQHMKPELAGECVPSMAAFQKVLDTRDWSNFSCSIHMNESYLHTKKAIQKDFAQSHRTMYSGVAQTAMVDEKYATISTLVHEFAHSICPGKVNEIYQQQVGVNPNFMPFRRMYNTYMRELHGIEQEIMKVRNSYAGQPDGLRLGIEAAKDLQAKYDSLCISKYSKASVGEFIAEAFCDAELSSKPKPASIEVKKTIIKLFGKDVQK